MIFRIMISILTLTLTACGGKTDDKSAHNNDTHRRTALSAPKIDYKKAALLNVEMGEKYLAMGQVPRAKKKLIHALELMPNLPEAHSAMGYFYETVGDVDEAEKHHKSAIKYASGSAGKFNNNYGIFLCRQKRYKDADVAFNKAIKDKQYLKTAEAYENAGMCALLQADSAKAYEYLQRAIKSDPQRINASLELAKLEAERHNYLAAKEYLAKYQAQAETNPKALWLGIQINSKLGRLDDVASAAMLLKGKYPDSAEYKLYLESTRNG